MKKVFKKKFYLIVLAKKKKKRQPRQPKVGEARALRASRNQAWTPNEKHPSYPTHLI